MLKLKNLNKIAQPYRDRVKEYTETLYNYFGDDFIGLIVYGSVARAEQKITEKYESDVDVLAVIENLPKRFSLKRMNTELKVKSVYSVTSEWVTKWELDQYFGAKTGFVLDAFDEGIFVYDPKNYLAKKRDELFRELMQKNVIKNPKLGWVFPVKIGEKIEY
ncbi:MAG: hypothetical protein AB1349_05755 [Elusimicrobiota bacterium]